MWAHCKLTVDLLEGKPIDDHPEVVKKGKRNHHRPIITETSRRIEDEGPIWRTRAKTPRSRLPGIASTTALLLLLLRRVPPETVIQRERALINYFRPWTRPATRLSIFSVRTVYGDSRINVKNYNVRSIECSRQPKKSHAILYASRGFTELKKKVFCLQKDFHNFRNFASDNSMLSRRHFCLKKTWHN